MKRDEMQEIADTLFRVVKPDMSPKELLKAVKKAHPDASKKDVVRAAFLAIIANADGSPEKAEKLQAFAIGERSGTG